MVSPGVIAAFICMIACTVVGNLLLKIGVSSSPNMSFLRIATDLRVIAGLGVFGMAIAIYAWLLTFVPLNIAQSFMAAQFVCVILASAVVLAEPIPSLRWVGIILIATGIVVVGLTADIAAR